MRTLARTDAQLIAIVEGTFTCRVRDPEDCDKVTQFLHLASEEANLCPFAAISVAKLAFKRAVESGGAAVVGTDAGAPAAVVFDTKVPAAAGGSLFAVVAVWFVAREHGETPAAAGASVTFRNQHDLPEIAVRRCLSAAELAQPSAQAAMFRSDLPLEVDPSLGWKMLMPQNPSGLGPCGHDGDVVCPDGVRGVVDVPADEYCEEFAEPVPVPAAADDSYAGLTAAQKERLLVAKEAASRHPASLGRGQERLSSPRSTPLLAWDTRLPRGLARNSRLFRLPKGLWDGKVVAEVTADIVEQANRSVDFARRNPTVAVPVFIIGQRMLLHAIPFICPLGPSQAEKMCAALVVGSLSCQSGARRTTLTILPLHQAFPLASAFGAVKDPAHSWLHPSPRTPWCDASSFDGKFGSSGGGTCTGTASHEAKPAADARHPAAEGSHAGVAGTAAAGTPEHEQAVGIRETADSFDVEAVSVEHEHVSDLAESQVDEIEDDPNVGS
ncbi:hypothetical protein FNF29_05192 [Cafeteria roenbergensis]|uniref:Uncharacterized protein n=1 Tax=Cafeteria roenbergensis TaxID=33653 RepID=A0A5A8CDD2_CAFRO|nr:hypothetical protein FNF29_05192 [Cafeteria roenbergensis]|eukprot:KAA0150617.1 hypothetical protein FNF29_05192 [Cafeteria roenbergensis]